MREYKFRAWYNGRMYAVNQIIWYSETNIVCGLTKPQVPGSQIWVGTTEAEVQEYTGLTDKTGKEVYEGDIVKGFTQEFGKRREHIDLVEYDEYQILQPFYHVWTYDADFLIDCFIDGFEVIGNIYQNPELLEAQP